MADGLLSPDDMMLQDEGLLFDPRLVNAYTPTSDPMNIAETGAMMMPLSAFYEMTGNMPNPMGEGYLPSTAELIRRGDYEGLGYQLLGASGDALYAASPLFPFLAAPATGLKATRAQKLMDSAAPKIGGKTGLTPARKQGIRREADRKKTYDFDSTYGNAPDRDFERVTDIPIETRDFIELDPLIKAENIEPLLGETLLPVVWDRLATGKELVKYGDTILSSPEAMYGGIRYPLLPQDTVLASTESAVKGTIAPAAKKVKELTGKDPIITNVVMAGSGVDFATPTLQTYVKSLPSANITQEGAEKIKEAILKSKDGKKFADIPLVTETEKFADYVSKLGGTSRANLVKRLDQRTVVDQGSPNITSIRRAITDDDLLYEMPSQSGNMFSRLDANRGLLFNPKISNPSYNAVMEGQSLLGLERSVPASIMFRPFYLSKYMDEAGEFLPSATVSASGKQNFYDANKTMDAMKKIMPMSEVDDQMLEEIRFYNSLFEDF